MPYHEGWITPHLPCLPEASTVRLGCPDALDVQYNSIICAPIQPAANILGITAVNQAINITLRTGLTPVAMEPRSLATIGLQVDQKFAKLVVDNDRCHYSDSLREILIDQRQRFRLWADNMGLCNYGHHSLDYRCRDAPKVYEYGRQLLTDLEDTLDLSKSFCIVRQP